MEIIERIRRHERKALAARKIADAATRLYDYHSRLADELKKLADAAERCTGQSHREGESVVSCTTGDSHGGELV